MPSSLPPFTWTSYSPVARAGRAIPILAVSCFLVGVGIGHFTAARDASPHITLIAPGSLDQVHGRPNGVRPELLSLQSGPSSAPLLKVQSPEPVPAIIINPNSTAPGRQAIPARRIPSWTGERIGSRTHRDEVRSDFRSASPIPRRERARSSGSSDYSDLRRSLLQE